MGVCASACIACHARKLKLDASVPYVYKSHLVCPETRLSPKLNCASMAASPPPWNSWSLDEQFFGSLCRWTVNNPGNSLAQVFEKITTTIDNTSDLRRLIPDAPFPARSLVEALLSLLKLGIVSCSMIAPRLPVQIDHNIFPVNNECKTNCSRLREGYSVLG